MRLALLTTTTTEEALSPELERFARTAEARGHACAVVRHGEVFVCLDGRAGDAAAEAPLLTRLPGALIGGPGAEALAAADLVIPKISLRRQCRGDFYLVEALDAAGVRFLQDLEPLEICRNKVTSLLRLSARGIPVPPTVVIRRPEHLGAVPRLLGAPPWVVKPSMGSKGRDVLLARDEAALRDAVETLWAADRHDIVLAQPFLQPAGAPPWDLRAVVLLGQVVGAMRREAPPGDFRSNFSLGANVAFVELERELEILALDAARALSLKLAGVDILVGRDGPAVLEVNANPGWEGIAGALRAAGKDFHAAFLQRLEAFYP
ncbi:MAG: RimK family alpha-L-glutamate ligase [Acidobacteria bacterium]|nr:RimK family alpha-L-glutamate ligase [Acidobacteriota bacterium]